MSTLTTSGLPSFCLAILIALPAAGQSARKTSTAPTLPWRKSTLRFSEGKPALGMPGTHSRAYCSNGGTAFFSADSGSASTGVPGLFSVSPAAEVKQLQRKAPVDYTSLSILDFFAADHTLVTLLRAERREDDAGPVSAPRGVAYFLSTSDYDGDQAGLLALDLKFRPIKVALFGSGDFLILGWDDVNLIPLMALVKEDGTVRRFIDLDRKSAEPYTTYATAREVESSRAARLELATLERAVFVPFGKEVLLTYPGTARAVRVLSAVGEDRSIPIAIPSGFVLRDVLVSGERYPLILRTEEPRVEEPSKGDPAPRPPPRMFEMSSTNGSLIREINFDGPVIADIACAPDNKLVAIFKETVADTVQAADAAGKSEPAKENATQMVVAIARR